MYYPSALLATAAALAGTAAAIYSPQQLNRVRSLDQGVPQRRQDDSSNSAFACQASAFSILGDIPTPTPPLLSYLLSFAATANPTDPAALCAATSALPTSLASAYSSYDEAASSWYVGHSGDIAQLASDCASDGVAQSLTQAITALESYTAGDCTGTAPTEAAGLTSLIPMINATATGATATTTGSSSGAGSQGGGSASEMSSVPQAGAARPTGVIAGAMAAAGFIGAVAMM